MSYEIIKHHGSFNITRRTYAPRYIVVHYVGAGGHAKGAALNNCKYFAGGNRGGSAHYFVDDGSIYEYADPRQYATWHCGDGGGKYGIHNQNSIGIEVCINGDVPFTAAEIARLGWLVRKLMAEYSIPASNVVRHYDASRKQCPMYYAKRGSEWEALRKSITRIGGTWVKDEKGWWYKYADGSYPKSEWLNLGGIWYWFKADGYAARGWESIGGVWYWFDSSCQMAVGWRKVDGIWYYFGESGAMKTGWLHDRGSWYWLKSGGAMASDEVLKIGGKWYAFDASGRMDSDIEVAEDGSLVISA